ncbi:MAG: metal-dependent hydrolase, partial [Bacteroidetes bacterium SW_10_40_5]
DQEDDPKLSSHHHFFAYPGKPRKNATITELIYVPNDITDGLYLLNLQVPSIASDAAPSRPCLYALE